MNRLAEYVFPTLGDKPVDEIRRPELIEVLNPVWDQKRATGEKLLQALSAIFDYAAVMEYRTTPSPMLLIKEGLSGSARVIKHREALPYAKMASFVSALRSHDDEPHAKLAAEFTILTASRAIETRGAAWTEIDLDTRLWSIPGNRMKGKKPHAVPLSDRAVAILNEARERWPNSSLVFPTPVGAMIDENRMTLLAKRVAADDAITMHGMRSSFRDWCDDVAKADRVIAEKALAHALKDKTEAAYARSGLIERRRPLMQLWADFCSTGTAKTLTEFEARQAK
jgi:integrase